MSDYMKIYLDCCLFVLQTIKSDDKRKNDIKKLKLIVDKNNNLISIPFKKESNIKDSIRNKIIDVIGSNNFHLEQVHTFGETKFYNCGLIIAYLGITNYENIKKLNEDCKLVDFELIGKNEVKFDNKIIKYNTITKRINNSLEYSYDIDTDDLNLELNITELLTSYKKIVLKLDNSDIIFKFLPKYYTLEDVRIIYEKLKDTKVDKSNFRKKIIKYCKPTDMIVKDKGYRPTQLYEAIMTNNEIWL